MTILIVALSAWVLLVRGRSDVDPLDEGIRSSPSGLGTRSADNLFGKGIENLARECGPNLGRWEGTRMHPATSWDQPGWEGLTPSVVASLVGAADQLSVQGLDHDRIEDVVRAATLHSTAGELVPTWIDSQSPSVSETLEAIILERADSAAVWDLYSHFSVQSDSRKRGRILDLLASISCRSAEAGLRELSDRASRTGQEAVRVACEEALQDLE